MLFIFILGCASENLGRNGRYTACCPTLRHLRYEARRSAFLPGPLDAYFIDLLVKQPLIGAEFHGPCDGFTYGPVLIDIGAERPGHIWTQHLQVMGSVHYYGPLPSV